MQSVALAGKEQFTIIGSGYAGQKTAVLITAETVAATDDQHGFDFGRFLGLAQTGEECISQIEIGAKFEYPALELEDTYAPRLSLRTPTPSAT